MSSEILADEGRCTYTLFALKDGTYGRERGDNKRHMYT